jgi:hypothetical protein
MSDTTSYQTRMLSLGPTHSTSNHTKTAAIPTEAPCRMYSVLAMRADTKPPSTVTLRTKNLNNHNMRHRERLVSYRRATKDPQYVLLRGTEFGHDVGDEQAQLAGDVVVAGRQLVVRVADGDETGDLGAALRRDEDVARLTAARNLDSGLRYFHGVVEWSCPHPAITIG